MAAAQEDLGKKTVESSVGGGKVTVVATAGGDVLSIKIDPSIVDPADVEFLEELVLTGVQQALSQGKEIVASEMGKVTGGMGLPPGMGF
jgi:hypothetical protein